jgi:hypothetical protein
VDGHHLHQEPEDQVAILLLIQPFPINVKDNFQ